MIFYRCTFIGDAQYFDLRFIEYQLVKETPKGYWITHRSWRLQMISPKWISKTSRKRFAYPTKQEALTNYIKRTERRLDILNYQIKLCRSGIMEANQTKEKITT